MFAQGMDDASGAGDLFGHLLGGIVVKRSAGAGQADANAGQQGIDDVLQQLLIGLAHGAVTQDLGQRWQGGHQARNIAADGRFIAQPGQIFLPPRPADRLTAHGPDSSVSAARFLAFSASFFSKGGSCFFNRIAPHAGFDDGHGEIRLPVQFPIFKGGVLQPASCA